MQELQELLKSALSNPIVLAGLTGIATGTAVDWDAFKSFDSFGAAKEYRWDLAAWRAFKGLVIGVAGAASALGLGGLL
jgi:hypothetical protein